MVGNHSRRREDGFGGEHQRGAEDFGDRRRKLWRPGTTRCAARVRSALSVCVAHARYAVMSGASAAATLAEVRAKQLERSGRR